VATGVTLYEAHGLMTGKRVLSSKGRSQQQSTLSVRQVLVYCLFGILAGLIGGLLGMGGGFIMGPLFLELGIPPQVHAHKPCLFSIRVCTFGLQFERIV